MSDDDRATQAEQLIARMKAARGTSIPSGNWQPGRIPTSLKPTTGSTSWPWARGATSRPRCANSSPSPSWRSGARTSEGLVAHMRRAIRLGATKEELFEVLEATLVPGGAPTFHRGLSALLEVE